MCVCVCERKCVRERESERECVREIESESASGHRVDGGPRGEAAQVKASRAHASAAVEQLFAACPRERG